MHLLTTKPPIGAIFAGDRFATATACTAVALLLVAGSQSRVAAQAASETASRFSLSPSVAVAAGTQTPSPLATAGLSLEVAVRQTLSLQPNITLQQQQVEIARADLRTARGAFDELVAASGTRSRSELPSTDQEKALLGYPPSIVSNLTEYDSSLRKQFRSGLSVSPTLKYQRAGQSISTELPNRADVALNANYPLLRGRGREVVTANERVGVLGVQVSSLDLRQVQSERVLNTVAAYWNYVAARKRLDILVESEARSRQLVEETQALIVADKRPAADIKQANANLADRTASRLDAETTLFQASRDLGLAMGLPYESIDRLPAPTDDFPPVPEQAAVPPEQTLLREALRRRPDLQAAQGRQDQGRILVSASTDAMKHKLDLTMGLGYSGLSVGDKVWDYWAPFGNNVHGANASLGLSFEWPLKNDDAAGRMLHSVATLEQASIAAFDLGRTIQADVSVARDSVARRAEQAQTSRRAADLYRQATEDERQKQQLGTSTVIDLINTEDRLTSSLLSEISATLAYAVAVARLRFEAGVLLEGVQDPVVDPGTLTTVPQFEPGGE